MSAPFFNLWMVPIGLTLLFLTGVGPLMAWRKATPSSLRFQFTTPLIAMAVVIIACLAFGLHKRPVDADIGLTPPSGATALAPLVLAMNYLLRVFAIVSKKWGPVICFGMCGFVLASIVQEFARGISIRKRNTGQSVPSAFTPPPLRGSGVTAATWHISIMLMFFGERAALQKKRPRSSPRTDGDHRRYTVRFDKLAHEETGRKRW